MAIFKELSGDDLKTNKSFLNQLVNVINDDIVSGSTRRQYQVWVTGGLGPGVTSSLFQTVYDQQFTLQTANPIFDITFGFSSGSSIVTNLNPTIDFNGKYIFPSQSLMMREKMDIYRLFAQNLLGDAESQFTYTSGSASTIKNAMFMCFKRLFARDQIKRETFAMKFSPTASLIGVASTSPPKIYSDIGSSNNKLYTFGGQVSSIVDSANTAQEVGLLFIDKGIAVFDMDKVFDQGTSIVGTIDAVNASGTTSVNTTFNNLAASASLDDLIDHVCSTRFSGSSQTSIVFQNITNINSSLYTVNLGADEFNYSSNPTFTDSNNRIVVIDEGQEETQRTFTFVSSIGFYDANNNLLAVAKTSRPILKDDERPLTFVVRLDYSKTKRFHILSSRKNIHK